MYAIAFAGLGLSHPINRMLLGIQFSRLLIASDRRKAAVQWDMSCV